MFVKKLKGFDLYRLRVGDYRVIMSIEKKKIIIFVLDVGHRSVIYRNY
jgi:mRNA interferase RelE/StbE